MKIKHWDKRNVEYTNSQELVVRQVFKKFDPVTNLNGTTFVVGGFTVRNGRTDEVWHYVMTCAMSSGVISGSPIINVYNEDMAIVFQYDFATTPTAPPVMTYAVVEDQLLICCPGLPPLWGLVGGGLTLATLTTPTNQNTSSLESFPFGVCISWAGRAVIANGAELYFSDALDPRAYTGANFINPPGEFIYDMHVNSGGALIIVTSSGVYSLPEDASYSGIGGIVLPVWTKLTDYGATGYRKSVSYKGRVYGLTPRGFQLIDDKSSPENQISEKIGSRFNEGRIDYSDYRDGILLTYSNGIVVCMGQFACFIDIANKLVSWYSISNTSPLMDIKGILTESDGTDLYLMNGWTVVKNGDTGNESQIGGSGAVGAQYSVISGRVIMPPKASPVLRAVIMAINSVGDAFYVAVNKTQKSFTSSAQSPVVGTANWSSTAEADKVSESGLKSYDVPFAIRGDELTIEIGIKSHPTLIPENIDIVFKGPGKERPTR